VLKLIDITADNLPNIGDMIIDPSDDAIGVIYNIQKPELKSKQYLVYWLYCDGHINNSFDTQETEFTLLNFRLIPT
jgi:hypothetical protein